MSPLLGLVKVLHQCPSSSAGMTFNSSLLLLPDLDHLRRKVAMAISYSAQPKKIQLLYLIKCSVLKTLRVESQGQGLPTFTAARSLVTRSFLASQRGCSLPLCQAQGCFFFHFRVKAGALKPLLLL